MTEAQAKYMIVLLERIDEKLGNILFEMTREGREDVRSATDV